MENMIKVKKKDGTLENWDFSKIKKAVEKSSDRACCSLNDEDYEYLQTYFSDKIKNRKVLKVSDIHNMVESVLLKKYPPVGKSYREYRNFKKTAANELDKLFIQSRNLLYLGDKENANFNSSLTSTKSSLTGGYLRKSLYKQFYLSKDELSSIKDGYIYIHDLNFLLLNTLNCCNADIGSVLKGGFVMGGVPYTEPKTLLSACQVIGDLCLSCSAAQYGGFTIGEIDKILLYYYKKSLEKYKKEAEEYQIKDKSYIERKLEEELRQGLQSLEVKLNTITSSRGDTAFITFSFGCTDHKDEEDNRMQMKICSQILKTRMNGHGNARKPVLFPKLVYIYSKEQHKNEEHKKLFDLAIKCTTKSMYPDFLSADAGYTGDIYMKYGVVVSPMGEL